MTAKRPPSKKVTVSLTGTAIAAVEELQAREDLSVSEVVRRALATHHFLSRELAEEGSVLLLQRASGDTERLTFIYA